MQKEKIQTTIDNTKEFYRVILEENVKNNEKYHKDKAQTHANKVTEYGDEVDKEIEEYKKNLFSEAETKIEAYKVHHNQEETKRYENSIYEEINKEMGAYTNKLYEEMFSKIQPEEKNNGTLSKIIGWIVNPFLYNFYKDSFLYEIGVK